MFVQNKQTMGYCVLKIIKRILKLNGSIIYMQNIFKSFLFGIITNKKLNLCFKKLPHSNYLR